MPCLGKFIDVNFNMGKFIAVNFKLLNCTGASAEATAVSQALASGNGQAFANSLAQVRACLNSQDHYCGQSSQREIKAVLSCIIC